MDASGHIIREDDIGSDDIPMAEEYIPPITSWDGGWAVIGWREMFGEDFGEMG